VEQRTIEEVTFPGATGEPLAGALHLPEDADVRGGLLLAHCFTCGKDLSTMTRLARGLVRAGFAVLRFDFTGLGESGGDFSETTLATSVADLEAAVALLCAHGHEPVGMVGHSYGGAAAVLAAARVPAVASVAVLGAPSTPRHLARLLGERDGRPTVTVNERTFPLDPAFVDELHRHDMERALARLDRPLLVLHALDDRVVEAGEGEALFAAAGQPKAFVPLLDGGHLLADRRCAEDAVRILTDWFTRTLPAA
jgi:putative redox protein